MKRGQSASFIL